MFCGPEYRLAVALHHCGHPSQPEVSEIKPSQKQDSLSSVLVNVRPAGLHSNHLWLHNHELNLVVIHAGPSIGWRWPFIIVAAPAVVCAVLMLLTVKEPPRGASEDALQVWPLVTCMLGVVAVRVQSRTPSDTSGGRRQAV